MPRRKRTPARIKYRGKIRAGWFRRGAKRIGHGVKGVPYAIANSFAGLTFMRRALRQVDADRDCRMTKDKRKVVNHWVKAYEGWDDHGHGDVRRGVEGNVWADVQHWTAMGKYKIHGVYDDIEAAARLGYKRLHFEPKAPNDYTLADWQEIVRHCHRKGIQPRGYSYHRNQVELMREAGVVRPTVLRK